MKFYFMAFMLVVISLSFVSPSQGIQHRQAYYNLDQSSISVSTNTTHIVVYRNESVTLRVNVTVDSQLQSGAWFKSENFNYDLGERFSDYGNGTYDLYFVPDGFTSTKSDNYTMDLRTIYGSINTTNSINFDLLSYDLVDPILTVFSPTNGSSYYSYMLLNLTGSDDVGWVELQVTFRGQLIFILLENEEFKGRGEWNSTYLHIDTYIFFEPILGSDEIRITLFDTSYNYVEVIRNSSGDAFPPEVSWIRPFDGSIQTSRNIHLEWSASDNVGLSGFIVKVNSYVLGLYAGNVRQADVTVPIPREKVIDLKFTIIANDTSGNQNSAEITITYDPSAYKTENNLLHPSNLAEKISLVLLGGFILAIIVVLYLLLRSQISKQQQKAIQKFQAISSRDIQSLLDSYNASEGIKVEVETLIIDYNTKMKNKTKTDIENSINQLKSNFNSIISTEEYAQDASNIFSSLISSWYDQNY